MTGGKDAVVTSNWDVVVTSGRDTVVTSGRDAGRLVVGMGCIGDWWWCSGD